MRRTSAAQPSSHIPSARLCNLPSYTYLRCHVQNGIGRVPEKLRAQLGEGKIGVVARGGGYGNVRRHCPIELYTGNAIIYSPTVIETPDQCTRLSGLGSVCETTCWAPKPVGQTVRLLDWNCAALIFLRLIVQLRHACISEELTHQICVYVIESLEVGFFLQGELVALTRFKTLNAKGPESRSKDVMVCKGHRESGDRCPAVCI